MIRPLSDKTILRQELPKQVTDAGLHLLKESVYTEAVRPAQVVAVGSAVQGVHVGDRVLYHVQDATEFHHEGDTLQVVAGDKVIAVLESTVAAKPKHKLQRTPGYQRARS